MNDSFESQSRVSMQDREPQRTQHLSRNGWKYGDSNGLNSLMEHLSTYHPEDVEDWVGYDKEHWRELLEKGGGKAFGLELCEDLAALDSSGRLTVPHWEILDNEPEKLKKQVSWNKQSQGLLLRSSALDEDWVNPSSGTHETLKWDSWKPLPEKEEIPYVVQERKEGYGLVVDVCYSELLGKNVVKIASGGRSYSDFMSATNDGESAVGVWDAKSGEELLKTESFMWGRESEEFGGINNNTFFRDNYAKQGRDKLLSEMSKALADVVEKMGIKFGVQLELIIHPNNPEVWNLVQVRPTPGKMQKELNEDSLSDLRKNSLVSTSCVTSGVYDINLPCRLIESDGSGDLKMTYGNVAANRGFREEMILGNRSKNRFIAVYNSSVRMNASQGYDCMAEVWLRGAEGQVVCSPIVPDCVHGVSIGGDYDKSTAYELAEKRTAFLSIDRNLLDPHRFIKPGEETTPIRILINNKDQEIFGRLVSDGIVGKFALEKK